MPAAAAEPSSAPLSPPWSPDHATTPKPGKSDMFNPYTTATITEIDELIKAV
jgi:hypothetical protein